MDAGKRAEQTVEVPVDVTLDEIVVDGAGSPVAGAELRLTQPCLTDNAACLDGHRVATSAADGTFHIRSIATHEDYYVSARKGG
ncbi:MAG: hypothetical protein HYR85_17655 [Planctomycetes bacterium]|nr:hypothetical protein [Planctomycetota bacterium]MBI3845211.1 hypothetical protein [Planctomycetota bacterium]